MVALHIILWHFALVVFFLLGEKIYGNLTGFPVYVHGGFSLLYIVCVVLVELRGFVRQLTAATTLVTVPTHLHVLCSVPASSSTV